MLDRVIVAIVIAGGLGLLWLGWHYYKIRVLRTIQPAGASTGKPTLLYFTGEYCSPCKFQQTPIVERLKAKFGASITVKTYDVSTHPNLASQYRVLTLPTTIILDECGRLTHINRGVAGLAQLEAQLSYSHQGKLDELQYAP